MLSFSAGTHSKHPAGIQPVGGCQGPQQVQDCINDKGIQNRHGVWFIPGKVSTPPAGFQDLKYVVGKKMPVMQFSVGAH